MVAIALLRRTNATHRFLSSSLTSYLTGESLERPTQSSMPGAVKWAMSSTKVYKPHHSNVRPNPLPLNHR